MGRVGKGGRETGDEGGENVWAFVLSYNVYNWDKTFRKPGAAGSIAEKHEMH